MRAFWLTYAGRTGVSRRRRVTWVRRLTWAAAALICLIWLFRALPAYAHEPVFGAGPHTIFGDGSAVAIGYEQWQADTPRIRQVSLSFVHGLTPDVQLAAAVPWRKTAQSIGLGDASVGVKWRFWMRPTSGAVDGVSVSAALKLPSGKQEAGLSTGDAGYTIEMSIGHESLRFYTFASARVSMFDAGLESKPATQADGAASIGGRLWVPNYYDPDLVLLAEVLAHWSGRATAYPEETGSSNSSTTSLSTTPIQAPSFRPLHTGGGVLVLPDEKGATADTGIFVVRVAPTALLSWRGWMLKLGLALPVWTSNQDVEPDWIAKSSLIWQF